MGKQPDQVQNQTDQAQDQTQRQPGKEHPTVADESKPQGPNDRSRESDTGTGDEGNRTQREQEDRIGTPKDPRPIVQSPQDDLA